MGHLARKGFSFLHFYLSRSFLIHILIHKVVLINFMQFPSFLSDSNFLFYSNKKGGDEDDDDEDDSESKKLRGQLNSMCKYIY